MKRPLPSSRARRRGRCCRRPRRGTAASRWRKAPLVETPILGRRARRCETIAIRSAVDQRHPIRPAKAFLLEVGGEAVARVLGTSRRWDAAAAPLRPCEAAASSCCGERADPKPPQPSNAEEVGERGRSEVDAIATRRDRARRFCGELELRERQLNLAVERVVASTRTRHSWSRHRLVGRVHEAPVEVEAAVGVPVALSERVGEPAVDPAGRVDSDEVTTPRGVLNLLDGLGAREESALEAPGRSSAGSVAYRR